MFGFPTRKTNFEYFSSFGSRHQWAARGSSKFTYEKNNDDTITAVVTN